MGNSAVEFHGRLFWARDAVLEVWLHLLATEVDAEVDAEVDVPDWLRQAGRHWYQHAHVGFTGCISPELDKRLCDPDRVARALVLCRRARDRLAEWGPMVPVEVLESFDLGTWLHDVDVRLFLEVADAFTGLLRDEPVDRFPGWR